ncbi:MAG: hypothetical protein UZ22_OP11002000516 [Microgenomates bacterium OLB23]|nr:MAG: hypothetical protein UZ22_OP11002000516 [Microgenomates bacterium OLB23]
MDVAIVAPAFVTDQPDSKKLLLCNAALQADINNDGTVNTFDYAVCLDEFNWGLADVGKLQCDLNVNRRIDATDLSVLITHIKKK